MAARHYFAGEHTTTRSITSGLIPNRECGHRHRTEAGADRCAAIHGCWVVYVRGVDGYTRTADWSRTLELTI